MPGTWALRFDDEFSGSSLDLTKWQPNWLAGNNTDATKADNSDDLNCETPSQVAVSGGSLGITATSQPCQANNGTTYPWRSGLVNTHGTYTFQYGVIEARVYIDDPCVNFPAFWADGSETGGVTWPTFGELDVYECLGTPSWHVHSPSGAPGRSLNLTAGWHTLAVNVQPGNQICGGATPDAITAAFYYDGQNVGGSSACIDNTGFYIILDNDVSALHGGPTEPNTMRVDYVRAWQ